MGNPTLEQDSKTSETPPPPPPYSTLNESGIRGTPVNVDDLAQVNSVPSTDNVTVPESVAHLKLISAIASLRDSVMKTDNLFGICDDDARGFSDSRKQAQAAACIKEKRWAVYVARAVERFTTWWENAVPTLETTEISSLNTPETKIAWSIDMLPPFGEQISNSMSNQCVLIATCRRYHGVAFIYAKSSRLSRGLSSSSQNGILGNGTSVEYNHPVFKFKYLSVRSG